MRNSTLSPTNACQWVMPKSLRLSVVLAENPSVWRNGGIGWRAARLSVNAMHNGRVTPCKVSAPQAVPWLSSVRVS